MFKGYYMLTSGMLTQNRNLNVVSNNLTNVLTPGFKKDTLITSTFQDEMMYRTGNTNKSNPTALNTETSAMRLATDVTTSYVQGALEETNYPFDFALTQTGFFQIQTEDGVVYTRNGAFSIDEEGYLALSGVGRVLGENGEIYLGIDNIMADSEGVIYGFNREPIDKIAIVDFPDYNQLAKAGESLFQSAAQPEPVNRQVLWKTLERSNVSAVEEMTAMLESQRAIQSCSQVVKMFDQIMAKATTELGRI